ncbi:MAG: ArnT family glycosyltransferase, partial [[Clostridium] symbiosum]
MKTDSGGRDYKSKYTEKSITGRKADREYKAQPYIAAGISGRGGPVTVLERLCTVFVQFLFGAVHLFLIAISATVTCSVYGGEEKVQYGPDQPVVHILLLIVFLAAGVWFYRKRRIGADRFSLTVRQYRRLIIAVAGFDLIWLLITRYWPNSDQRMAMESARSLLSGDYSPWDAVGFVYASPMVPLGYAYTYPSQNGLILFLAVIVMIFRDLTPYAVQILNIGFLFGGVYFLSCLAVRLFGLKSIRGILILTFGCLPFAFYITFVYGTMPGFCLSSAALYFVYRYIETEKLSRFFIVAVTAAVSVLLKSNYLIVLVALVIYLLSEGVFRRKARFLAAAVLMILVYMGSGRLMNMVLEQATGRPVSGGIPMTAWVEMGLQEGSRGPGWYNGYNVSVFAGNDEDTEKT